MYINSGYRNNSLLNYKDKSRPLIVGSCGTYRLSTHPRLPTFRPGVGWITRSSMWQPAVPTFILAIRKMTRS